MATSIGKLEVEVEVKCAPEKFWQSLRDSTTLFPKALPQEYKSIEVLEGDGKAVGSIRFIHYSDGFPIVTSTKEKIEAVDEENKTVSYEVIGGDLFKYYKSFKAHFSVIPKGEGSIVKWASEFEKTHEEIPDPHLVRDFVVKNFQDLDDYLKA